MSPEIIKLRMNILRANIDRGMEAYIISPYPKEDIDPIRDFLRPCWASANYTNAIINAIVGN